MLPCRLTCILANSKGCAQWESRSFPREGWRMEMFPLPLRTMVCIGGPPYRSVVARSGQGVRSQHLPRALAVFRPDHAFHHRWDTQ